MNQIVYQMDLITESPQSVAGLDYFFLASGSDNRAYKVLSSLKRQRNKKPQVIIFNFKERVGHKQLGDRLFDYQSLPIASLQEIYCEIKNPSSSLDEIAKNSFYGSDKIGIDISCFTKPYFYFLIKLLKERFSISNILTFYTEPKSYFFPRGLYNAFRSSTGPLSIVEIPGFSGHETRGSDRSLVLLLGFDGDLSKEINEDVAPNKTIVVNGFPSYSPKFKDISLIANEKLRSDHRIEKTYARANNPFEVYNLLESIKRRYDRKTFMNIAPLGTKPMALGACLFGLHHPDVRVIYPLPDKYEDKYSDDSWNSWVYNLPLII